MRKGALCIFRTNFRHSKDPTSFYARSERDEQGYGASGSFLQREQMRPCPFILYFPVQFPDIVSDGQQRYFSGYTDVAKTQETAEVHICLQLPETSFCLNTPVHTQQTAFVTCNAFWPHGGTG